MKGGLPVPDVLGSMGIVKSAQRLLLALHGGSYGGNDAGFGAPSKRVAQESGQLAVSVGNVP